MGIIDESARLELERAQLEDTTADIRRAAAAMAAGDVMACCRALYDHYTAINNYRGSRVCAGMIYHLLPDGPA